jgi:hypothetical protein
MPFSNYSELKTFLTDMMVRSDLSGNTGDFIALAEARLNREIPAVETDVTLTGTLDSRRIDVSANSVVSGIALFLVDTDGDEIELTQRSDGSFPYTDTSDQPKFWAMDSTSYIDFDCPLDQAYTFRFRIRQRYALSDSATTNWLLTYHPDIYIAASLIWGGGYIKDFEYAGIFNSSLMAGIESVKHVIMEQNRGVLTVDPALTSVGRYTYSNWLNDT